jgi:hypothetical protein
MLAEEVVVQDANLNILSNKDRLIETVFAF